MENHGKRWKIDDLTLQGGFPERRQRMAILTKSALLRKKILSVVPRVR